MIDFKYLIECFSELSQLGVLDAQPFGKSLHVSLLRLQQLYFPVEVINELFLKGIASGVICEYSFKLS